MRGIKNLIFKILFLILVTTPISAESKDLSIGSLVMIYNKMEMILKYFHL